MRDRFCPHPPELYAWRLGPANQPTSKRPLNLHPYSLGAALRKQNLAGRSTFLNSTLHPLCFLTLLQLIEGEKASIRPRSTTRAGAHIRRHPFPSKDSFI